MRGEAVIALRRVLTSGSGKAPDVRFWHIADRQLPSGGNAKADVHPRAADCLSEARVPLVCTVLLSSCARTDIALVPWILRARDMLGVELDAFSSLSDWLARLEQRPAIAAEAGIVAAL